LSSAALSLEISGLVQRAKRGEAIDASSEGAELAVKYPELGISGELIGKAIARAAGMVGVILKGVEDSLPPPA
jgi:hypothetical protein